MTRRGFEPMTQGEVTEYLKPFSPVLQGKGYRFDGSELSTNSTSVFDLYII